jgi:hypothetical protein
MGNLSKLLSVVLVLVWGQFTAVQAVVVTTSATDGTYTYQTESELTSGTTAVTNWSSGWGGSGISGWDYVGTVNGASGVYLGNGWVITAAHVGAGDFTLNGVTYSIVSSSIQNVGTVDLTMFQITEVLSLPSLTISTSTPGIGTSVVMIGYGGGIKAWGQDRVTAINDSETVNGRTSLYFNSLYGTFGNTAEAITGDSGGASFVYNSSTGKWELAGILGAIATGTNAYETLSIQTSTYSSTINQIMGLNYIPEPSVWVLMATGFGILLLVGRPGRK